MRKRSLKWYKKAKPKGEQWYDGSWESKILYKARTNTLEVQERKNRWRGEGAECHKCAEEGEQNIESLEHIIKECPGYIDIRQRWEEDIIRDMGQEHWDRIKQEGEDMETILGFKEEEGISINATKKHLVEIWKRRQITGDIRREIDNQEEHNYGRRE